MTAVKHEMMAKVEAFLNFEITRDEWLHWLARQDAHVPVLGPDPWFEQMPLDARERLYS